MKAQLLELYQQHLPALKAVVAAHPSETLLGPHLMAPNDLYPQQKNRLLIVGQETGGWDSFVDDPVRQMQVYEEFNVGKGYFSSPFWNVTRKVEKLLGNKPHSCAWTNVSKFDHNKKRAEGIYEKTIASVDGLLRDEIRILEPTFCLFYTGPAFDMRLMGIFKGLAYHEVPGYDLRALARLEHPLLPERTYRSYHPNYLRQQGLEEGFLDFIRTHLN
jgi:hypothetical protein